MSIKSRLSTRSVGAIIALCAVGGGAAGTILGATGVATAASGSTTTAPAASSAAPTPKADRPAQPHGADDVATAATALGLSRADLQTALQGGKSIAQVATDKGVDLAKVTAAIKATDVKAIDDAVAAGSVTQAQADAQKAGLDAHIQQEVTQVGGPQAGGHGGHGRGGGGGGVHGADDVATAATALGMSEADLQTALQGGKSIAQVATDKGVDLAKVTDAIKASDVKAIDDAVAAGKLTQAQADAQKAGLDAHIKDEVTRVGFQAGGPKGGHGPRGGVGSSATSSTTTP